MDVHPTDGRGTRPLVRARVLSTEQWSLERLLSQLAFIDAINGFMRSRSTPEVTNAADRTRITASFDTALGRFTENVSADEAPVAHSVRAAMRRFAACNEGRAREQAVKAADLFRDAARRTSDLPEARNLAAVTRPLGTDELLNVERRRGWIENLRHWRSILQIAIC